MNIEKLAPFAIVLALYTVTKTGSMINAINFIRRAEVQLIQDTKASKWPKAPMLPKFHKLHDSSSSQ